MTRKFETFIFDLDGTLLDTVPDLELLTNRVLTEMGYPTHTRAEIQSYVGSGVKRLMYLAMPKSATEDESERAMALWSSLFPEYYKNSLPFPGICKMIGQLKAEGCKLGVVSNKFQRGVNLIMEKTLPHMTDVMLGEGEGVPRKPDPTGILKAMEMLGGNPDTTLYVGDSPSDITAAKNAAVASCVALWGYHKKEDFDTPETTPDYFASTPEDVAALA